ncbi:MAG TPA: 3-oxoacyl-ACP synthase [Porphyromonadaceae bacterium]|nr:3-oxoacyl-ACP synthase [Porphyromonadaceae bacterium]
MYINAMGYYVPSIRIDNNYFKNINGLDDDWIRQRTGIVTRSKCAEGENVNTMGIAAVEDALKHLPYDVKDVDLIVAAHYCVYDSVATVAHEVQRKFGIAHAKAVYASSACSSFINGLEIVEGYFASGKAKKAILVCSEHNTYYSNEADPKSGHLWGDGAVAYFLSCEKAGDGDVAVNEIFTEGLGDVGRGPGGVKLRPAEDGITMPDGRDVFIHACRYMIYAINKALANAGLTMDDIDKIICHQANKRIVAQVAHQLGKEMDFFINNIEELGNTGSASAPLVLAQHRDEFKPGQRAALAVFGGGYSCGCFIVEF